MKVGVAMCAKRFEATFGLTDGGIERMYRPRYPLVLIRQELERRSLRIVTRREIDLSDADMVVFCELNAKLWRIARSLPRQVPCILICWEPPKYRPMCHSPEILLDRRWSAVLTWHRAIDAEHIHHFDLPVAPATKEVLVRDGSLSSGCSSKGIAVVSRGRSRYDPMYLRALALEREELYTKLAGAGHIDIYGQGWPRRPRRGLYGPHEQSKFATVSRYAYSMVSENSRYSGYVTEKLPESILAGVPAIYHGDFEVANRMFGGTFVQLDELSVPCFLAAKDHLMSRYAELKANVLAHRMKSEDWHKSFLHALRIGIDTMLRAHSARGERTGLCQQLQS